MSCWLFQANPKSYRVLDGIRDFDELYWQVTRYTKEMQQGDQVAIWVAGREAGIYAFAELTTNPEKVDYFADDGYWNHDAIDFRPQERLHAGVRFTRKLLDRPLLRVDLKRDVVLKDLHVIKVPQGTNFRLSEQEWQRIQELCAAG